MVLGAFTVVLVLALMAMAYLAGRYLQQSQPGPERLSAVTRQHFELFQSGNLNEAAVETAKRRFRALLERGEDAAVEASLRPGMQYVFQVRALAEIGTEAAGQILERQLQRQLSDDHVEQAWYWIDLASSLRALNRQESLPHLFRCSEAMVEVPLGHFFAAETVCFLGFGGYVQQPETSLGRSALRVLHRALEALRSGMQPHLVAEARLGEVIEGLWDRRPVGVAPLLVRVVVEVLRLLRRVPHAMAVLTEEPTEREAYDWQVSRLAALEPTFRDYLQQAPTGLRAHLPYARGKDLADVLRALDDLRADAGRELLPLLERARCEHAELTVEALRWARDPQIGLWLRDFAGRRVNMARRAQRRRRSVSPRHLSLPDEVPYRAILRSLRGHPSRETERFLILAAQDWDPLYRTAALGSLGWWEPLLRDEVLPALESGRRDPSQEVRQAARGALARLGERSALHWFRQALQSENPAQVFDAVNVVAAEGLTLLWPDLDRLVDSEQLEIAHHAREALERLSEEMDHSRLV
jgi:hypothetical protein